MTEGPPGGRSPSSRSRRESPDLAGRYRGYIDVLNRRAWDELGAFVHRDVVHNGARLGLAGYREMLERDVRDIPDLRFTVGLLVCDASTLGARLAFDCRPAGLFRGLAVDGRRVTFAENVFYAFAEERIRDVWSVIDRAEIAAQL